MRLTLAIAALVLLLAGCAQTARAECRLFPKSWPLNQRVDRLPTLKRSNAIIQRMGRDTSVFPDFGTGPGGLPYNVVGKRTPRKRVSFFFADDSDHVRYPLRRGLRISQPPDRHALIWDRSGCRLYELFDLKRTGGRWSAGSGATWNLRSARVRPRGLTSADAAGLPILPLLIRRPEVRSGRIRHALRMSMEQTRAAFSYPARHFASASEAPTLPRMGERLRLKAGVDISGLPFEARVIARALREYGVVVADNGSDWALSGAGSQRWDIPALNAIRRLKGSDFEVVNTRSLAPRGER